MRGDTGRTLLSVIAVALGVGVVIAIRVASRSAVASFQIAAQTVGGGADLVASGPQPVPATLLPQLFPLNDRAEFSPYLDRRAYDAADHDTLEVLGIDLLAAGANSAPRRSTAEQRPGTIFLAHQYVTAHRLRAGESLTLESGGHNRRFRIAVLTPAATTAPADLGMTDLDDALVLFEPGQPPSFDGLRIFLAPEAKAEEVTLALRRVLPAADAVGTPHARIGEEAKMLAAFRANLQALAYVSLLVGIFLIFNTVSISVVRRRTAIATLRALGASRWRIQRLFLMEGVVLSLCGGFLGLGLGWVLAVGATALTQATINNLYVTSPPTAAIFSGRSVGKAPRRWKRCRGIIQPRRIDESRHGQLERFAPALTSHNS